MYTKSKYRAVKTTVDGITFASRKEAGRYCELKILQEAGIIKDLRMQVPYLLIDSQRRAGKVVERKCVYVADFVYQMDGETVVEDVKGIRTEAYRIKRKLMLERYDIQIKEV